MLKSPDKPSMSLVRWLLGPSRIASLDLWWPTVLVVDLEALVILGDGFGYSALFLSVRDAPCTHCIWS